MKLLELQAPNLTYKYAVSALQTKFHLEQVGGSNRIYTVGDQKATIWIVNGGSKAVALAYENGSNTLSAIYVWDRFSIYRSPDFVADVPDHASVMNALPAICEFIKRPKVGPLTESILREARQVTPDEFKKLAVQTLGGGAAKASLVDMNRVAQEHDIKIPGSVRMDRNIKVDAHHWNLTDEDTSLSDKRLSQTLGGEMTDDLVTDMDPEYQRTLDLTKVKELKKLSSSGKLILTGKNARGKFFKIDAGNALAQLERMLTNELAEQSGIPTMEEQYALLKARVKLVAGQKTASIKSLLITGSPSSGKTFSVMQTIKQLGLTEGNDYIIKKGRITVSSLYRTLIEQINGLIIFDDCDSVVEDKNGINMLKGALDTDPIREISYDVKGTINTAVMGSEQRDIVVQGISNVLRGKGTEKEVDMFRRYLKPKKEPKENYDYIKNSLFEDEDDDIDFGAPGEDFLDANAYDDPYLLDDLHELQAYFTQHMPNKIDFKGRIIFISNMTEDDWDSAILTRAFYVNMNFSDAEMLDYIDKIKNHIKTPNISDEQKQETMDYLRQLWTTGKIKRPVNFRLAQACFDLRLVDEWKELMKLM